MKTSIVVPSLNQNRSLERSLRSVWDQEIGDLECLVVDGGSTDGSVEMIQKHAARLAYWRSRPDRGYADALNEGFAHSTGEIMGWLNAGDRLTPWALRVVESVFQALPEVEWITTLFPLVMNEEGVVVAARYNEGFNAGAFYRGRNIPLSPRFPAFAIPQESTFWRRSLWERTGARMDDSLRLAGDFELWARFFKHAKLYAVGVPLGCSRFRKPSPGSDATADYLAECRTILRRYGYRPPARLELAARQAARLLPRRARPWTGLAYPVVKIRQERRGSEWIVFREWIL
ncbi:MAG: glycosyltransferase family 2 protein [Anaerolineales bacterium]